MQVKIKKLHGDAVIPCYAKDGDAGLDLVAISKGQVDSDYQFIEYGTGLAIEIPEGYVGLLFPRSSISKTSLALTNAVGVIDSGYRGEVKFRFNLNGTSSSFHLLKILTDIPILEPYLNEMDTAPEYQVGDKIGQLIIMPYPKIEFEEVEELSSTERGAGGYGSTGA